MRTIATQMAHTFYGKPLDDCLGKGQTFLKGLENSGKSFRIVVPMTETDMTKYDSYVPTHSTTREAPSGNAETSNEFKKLIGYIKSMTKHANSNGMSVTLEWVG